MHPVMPPLNSLRLNRRLMAYTAAGMYGAAAFDGLISALIPADPPSPVASLLVAFALFTFLMAAGPRLPRSGLALFGPIGVLLNAYALTRSPSAGDSAVLYMWPVLWTAFFFGRRGALAIVTCVGVAHGLMLLDLPASSSYFGRWLDVMTSVSVVATVTLMLVRRNESLLTRLAEEARTDTLTGLLNRRGFEERAALELAHAKRNGESIAIASFDLDHFKHINDEWGHDTGDRVLARTGEVLAAHSRDIDIVARFGGEEFLVLLPGSNSTDAEAFTQRIRRALAAGDSSELPTVRISAGVIAAMAPENIEELLQDADAALYDAKRTGRNRTVISEHHDPAPAGAFR
jgi:diguanylate cyclase (GGDEF)-like protein